MTKNTNTGKVMDKTPKDFLPDWYLEDVSSIDENLLRKGSSIFYAKQVKTYGDRANNHLKKVIDKSENDTDIELARALIQFRKMVGSLTAVVLLKKG